MSKERVEKDLRFYSLIGVCLLYVQRAESLIEGAIDTVLADKTKVPLLAQAEPEQRRTLGALLKELKGRAKVDHNFKETLYRFLKLRNTFIHNISEIPGSTSRSEEGRAAITRMVLELIVLSFNITGVFVTLLNVGSRDEFGEDLIERNAIIELLEKHYGEIARQIWSARVK